MTDISVGEWQHRCSYHLLSFDTIGGQLYSFSVNSQEHVLHGACEIKREARYFRWNNEPEDGMTHSGMECNFKGSTEGNLRLDETRPPGTKAGTATFGSLVWNIRSVHGEGWTASISPLGYEIVSGDQTIAAVESVATHRLLMHPTLSEEEQQHVLGIAGALLLYNPPAGLQEGECGR